jgi:DNA gyrase subunit B
MGEKRDYSADNIKVLKGLEAVRKRPGMYIGDTEVKGFHHLIWEVVDNSVDESVAGFCKNIDLEIFVDRSVQVSDNGRGIPVDIHEIEKISAATVVLTVLHAGGKFDDNTYKTSGGLHGVGISVVNALSTKLILTIKRDGKIYQQEFEKGIPLYDLKVVGDCDAQDTGTTVRYWPDFSIFREDLDYNELIVMERLKNLAYLNSGLNLTYKDHRNGIEQSYQFENGLVQFVKDISGDANKLKTPILQISGNRDKVEVDIAFSYSSEVKENIYTFANNIKTVEHGRHYTGFRNSLRRMIANYIKENGVESEKKLKITGENVIEGLNAVVSVKVPEPQFEGQVKGKLSNREVESAVYEVTNTFLKRYFEENPKVAKTIMNSAILANKAQTAADKARDVTRKADKNSISSLPGKLANCQSRNPEECEIYLVEGDSAGGSAKQGRDRKTQAILPLKGKILNVEKQTMLKMLKSKEVQSLITALKTGIGKEFDIEKLRYHKIIIMTDADVDGEHIQTLILTLFFRYLPELIQNDHLYIAQPPLYRYKKGAKEIYLKDDKSLFDFLLSQLDIEEDIKNSLIEFKEIFDFLTIKYNSRELIDFISQSNSSKDSLEKDFKKYCKENGILISSEFKDGNSIFLYIQTKEGLEQLQLNSEILEDYKVIKLQKLFNNLKEKYNNPYKDFEELITSIKKGAYIQRYKGLGEMNPEQLWETTMDPNKRELVQVTISDAIEADATFTMLMGSEVAGRKDFIFKNGKFV